MIVTFVEAIEDKLRIINVVNLEMDLLILILYFYLCIPLGIVFNSLKCKNQRILFNLFFGLFFTMIITKEWFIYIFTWTILIYFLSRIFKDPYYPIFFGGFLILSYCHVYRLIYDYLSWKMDYNCVQMMITARYIYYAVDKPKIKENNSFLMFMSYIFMYPNLYLAPLPYFSFVDLITRKEDFTHYSIKPALINLFKAMLFTAGELFIRPKFDTEVYFSENWAHYNLIEKLFITQAVSVVLRFSYFTAFKHSQAAMDAFGITYNPKTKKCDRFPVADYHYDLEKNIMMKTSMWNTNVQLWLKHCFYEKLNHIFGGYTYYITFLISCIWHGFYMTYYLFFVFWAISVQICKYVYKAQQKFYFIPERIRHIICWFWSCMTIDHFATGMKILDWKKAIQFHCSVNWIIHIQALVIFGFFVITGFGQGQKRKKKD
ncbi:unnamed protein product [Paramecium sonneborni]|uniref:Uncharacterized protein n=1 Tax=Paramecium sonneborni TaxID=65129 RepID=A0A8S1R914_9CILI|nr:unnamed protein product [Paramecium sonneborni]